MSRDLPGSVTDVTCQQGLLKSPNRTSSSLSLKKSAAAILLCLGGSMGLPGIASAQEVTFAETAFDSCPAKAFLTQGKTPQTYAINLVTGDYQQVAATHGVKSPLNGVGFNSNDRFFYGWSYEHRQPARVHNDWTVEPLGDINVTNQNFYVGDVHPTLNKYFVYRRGGEYGLFSIGLDASESDYLTMNRVVDGSSLSLNIYDMSFHPTDGFGYAVSRDGTLNRIDVTDGTSVELGNIGHDGVFGAGYFDVNGNLYVGRNKDGHIFRIAIDSGSVAGELFAIGPASNTNDGSRCASAPLSIDNNTNIDFGDAPDSYGTSLANNGARHGLLSNPGLFLGESVDGESDSFTFPLSDDEDGARNDEDGIQFITSVTEGENAIVMVEASDNGFLNAWVDLNRDGRFDASEQVLADRAVQGRKQAVYFPVPAGIAEGETWARFRLSSSRGLEPVGGVADGEVEDLRVNLVQQPTIVTTYPSPSGWSTVAFEDNWPLVGDYDMNDLVAYMRTTTHRNASGYTKVEIKGEVAAVGAEYQNGFGIRLPGIQRGAVDEANIEFTINNLPVDVSPLEEGRSEAILIITENVFDQVGTGEHCNYYRTEEECGSDIQMSFSLSVPMLTPQNVPLSGVFDPFLFATPGSWHGGHFVAAPGRAYEIHLKNQAPTEAFAQSLFASAGQDASEPESGYYFQTDGGMPWALEIGDRWKYPIEFKEISKAYPSFKTFANSNGAEEAYWYDPAKMVVDFIFEE